jgi:hypothetical protein
MCVTPRQLGQTGEMPSSHPTAADDGHPDRIFRQPETPSFSNRSRYEPRRSHTLIGPGSRLAQAWYGIAVRDTHSGSTTFTSGFAVR